MEDQLLDPPKRRLRTCAADPDLDGPGQVDGPREHLGAGALLRGERLARDARLVEGRAPGLDRPVGGEVLAGTHPDQVSRLQGSGLDLLLAPVGQDPLGERGSQPDQRLDRDPRPERGPALDQLAQEREEGHRARGQVVLKRDGGDHGQRDQLVELKLIVKQVPGRAGHDGAGQDQGSEHRAQPGDGIQREVVASAGRERGQRARLGRGVEPAGPRDGAVEDQQPADEGQDEPDQNGALDAGSGLPSLGGRGGGVGGRRGGHGQVAHGPK